MAACASGRDHSVEETGLTGYAQPARGAVPPAARGPACSRHCPLCPHQPARFLAAPGGTQRPLRHAAFPTCGQRDAGAAGAVRQQEDLRRRRHLEVCDLLPTLLCTSVGWLVGGGGGVGWGGVGWGGVGWGGVGWGGVGWGGVGWGGVGWGREGGGGSALVSIHLKRTRGGRGRRAPGRHGQSPLSHTPLSRSSAGIHRRLEATVWWGTGACSPHLELPSRSLLSSPSSGSRALMACGAISRPNRLPINQLQTTAAGRPLCSTRQTRGEEWTRHSRGRGERGCRTRTHTHTH